MKLMIMILSLCFVTVSFAAEVSTDCPMMSERNDRSNPKASLAAKPKANTKKNTASAQ